jgi:hypothetical protein
MHEVLWLWVFISLRFIVTITGLWSAKAIYVHRCFVYKSTDL